MYLLDPTIQDLRFAVRMLRKSPAFTITAVLTIALGIGSNTAIFSVVRSVLLRPLPYADPERLVALAEPGASSPGADRISPASARAYRERSRTLENVISYNDGGGGRLLDGDRAEEFRGQSVSPEFFRTLGIHAELGRVFEPEDALPGRNNIIMLSDEIWQRLFGGDRGILGRTLQINGEAIRVVGVLRPDFHPFHMSNPGEVPQVFRPLEREDLESDDYRSGMATIARLKPGVTLAAARSDLNRIAQEVAHEHGDQNPEHGTVRVEPLAAKMTGGISGALWVLECAVGLVLLIACANVANLLLTRGSGRSEEIGIRAALGSGQWRLARQFLTESIVLSVLGGTLGVVLAQWAVGALVAAAPTEIPRVDEVRIDSTVLLVAFLATLGSGVLFGLAPAWRAWRLDLSEMLRGSRGGAGHGARRMRMALVAAEIACAFLLAIGATLLGRSLHQLLNVDAGYDPHHILTMTTFAHDYTTRETQLAYYRHMVERMRTLPGVESAAMVSTVPLSSPVQAAVYVEGKSVPGAPDAPVIDMAFASPEYFGLMRIPVLEGRTFAEHDGLHDPAVAVISRACARRLFPNQEPVGRHIQYQGSRQGWATVIGVVGDVWQHGMDTGPSPTLYIPQTQRPDFYYRLLVRTAGDPWQIYPAVRAALRDLDPREPVFHVQPMDAYVTKSLADRVFTFSLIGSLGSLALVLAAVGIYGVVSYTVSLRTREVGIRVALGAQRGDVIALVLRDLAVMLVWGLAAGFVAALCLTRLLSHLLYHVGTNDLASTLWAMLLLLGVALMAAYVPCRRAAAIAPSIALRHE